MVHGINGQMIMPLIALLLLVVAFFAKVRGGVSLAAMVLGGVVVQVALGIFGHGLPVLGLAARHAGHRDLRGRGGRGPAGGGLVRLWTPRRTRAPPASASTAGAAQSGVPHEWRADRRPATPGSCWHWSPPSRCWLRSAGSGRPACCPTRTRSWTWGGSTRVGRVRRRRRRTGTPPAAGGGGRPAGRPTSGPADVAVTLVARAGPPAVGGRFRRLHAQRQLARPGAARRARAAGRGPAGQRVGAGRDHPALARRGRAQRGGRGRRGHPGRGAGRGRVHVPVPGAAGRDVLVPLAPGGPRAGGARPVRGIGDRPAGWGGARRSGRGAPLRRPAHDQRPARRPAAGRAAGGAGPGPGDQHR